MAFLRTKSKGGRDYYYIVEGRRIDGKVKQTVLEYIGTEENMKKYVVEAYMRAHSVEDGSSSPTAAAAGYSFKSYVHGAPYALFRVAEIIGIEDAMKEIFSPKIIKGFPRERILLLSMLQRAVCPGSKRAFASWASTTSLPYHLKFNAEDMDSAAFWEAMDGITEEQIKSVWSKIVQKVLQMTGAPLDVLHLDYTNYYTFIDSKTGRCLVCKRGHNKQKRDDLRQFGLAAVTNTDLQIPLVWEMYDGNKNDKTEFADFTKLIKQEVSKYGTNPEDITLVFDAGSNSEKEFAALNMQVICAHSLAGHKHLYEIGIERYDKVEIMPEKEKLAYRIENMTFSGLDGVGILTFSDALKDGQVAELDKDIAKLKEEFVEVTNRLSNSKSRLYIDLKKEKDSFEFANDKLRRQNEEIEKHNQELQNLGKKRGLRKLKDIPVYNELDTMKKIIEEKLFKGMSYLKEFVNVRIEKNSDGRFQCQLDISEEKKNAYIVKYYGKKLICSTRKEWTTQQILAEYSRQECIENLFKNSKNNDHFSVRPQYHWTDDKIRTHLFCCLTALVITEVLRMMLKPSGIEMTKTALLDNLEKVRDGWVIHNNKKISRIIEDMTDQPDLQKLWSEVEKVTTVQ